MRAFTAVPDTRPTTLLFPVVLYLTLGLAPGGHTQGVESYAFVHPFGLSSATTVRQFGMGGTVTCVRDIGSGNPAFAAVYDQPNAGARWSATDFDRGPTITSWQLHAVYPFGKHPTTRDGHMGMALSLYSLDSSGGQVMLPGAGPVTVGLSEDDVSVHVGRRFGERWTVGLGISLYSEIGFSITGPGGLSLLDVEAKPDIGTRLGFTYEYAPGDFAGLVYDYYQETAEASGVLVGGATEQVFHTDFIGVGVSRHVRPDLLVLAEYQRGSSFRGAIDNALSGWHLGAEYRYQNPRRAGQSGCLRLGLNDGQLTCGLGYRDERWQADYAFANRWNDDIANGMFGGSSTHQLGACYRW